jgi:hypothetical protein
MANFIPSEVESIVLVPKGRNFGTYALVSWEWFSLPFLFEPVTLGFLITIIINSGKKDSAIFKGSALGTLTHVLNEDVNNTFKPLWKM